MDAQLRLSRWLAFGMGAVVLISVLGASGYTLWRSRGEAIDRNLALIDGYASLFEDYLTLNLRGFDALFESAAQSAGRMDNEAVQGLHDQIRKAPLLRSISVLDASGRVELSSNPSNVGVVVDSSPFFPGHKQGVQTLRIGPPLVGRDLFAAHPAVESDEHAELLSLLRSYSQRSGEERSVIGLLNTDHLAGHFQLRADLQTVRVDLLRLDGELLMSTAADGHQAPWHALPGEMERRSFGVLRHVEDGDGTDTLVAFRASSQFPFAVFVSLPTDVALTGWSDQARWVLTLAALVCATVLAVLFWLERKLLQAAGTRDEAVKALVSARDEAVRANSAKSRFLANISHELRTPMNGVVGMMELLRETSLGPVQRKYLQRSRASADDLMRLLDDLLDLAKLEHGKMTIEHVRFDLPEVFDAVLSPLAVRGHAKGLKVSADLAPDLPAEAIGDPLRLRQVLANLCDNALKFTEQGEIVVAAEVVSRQAGHIELSVRVRNTGAGIAQDKLSEIFDAFAQADVSTTRRFGGTGLGLAICAEITELLGGRIAAQSEPERGSEFEFRVPLSVPEGVAEVLPRSRWAGRRALLVGVSESARRGLGRWLTHLGVVPEVADGQAVPREPLAWSHYDLVLVGSGPGANGVTGAAMTLSDRVVMLHEQDDSGEGGTADKPGVLALGSPPSLREFVDVMERVFESAPQAAPAVVEAVPAKAAKVEPRNILVTDDNLINREVVGAMLRNHGHVVRFAENGQQAVDLCQQELFDVILMDVQMPVMDGLEATRTIRAGGGRNATTRIIAMTAGGYENDKADCVAAGMTGYVGKPVIPARLYELVERSDI